MGHLLGRFHGRVQHPRASVRADHGKEGRQRVWRVDGQCARRHSAAPRARRVDLAESRIGVAVRAGAPKPDISTVDALRRTLLGASSIAYSASASGVYISTELYKRLGIEAEVMPKSRRILSERAAAVVARGEAEIGFQQISEIIGIPGAELVGPLPTEVQQVTVFSAGVLTIASQPEAAAELIRFLASPDAAETVASTGLDPLAHR